MSRKYIWSGDFFCEGDVVPYLTDYVPWDVWKGIGNEPGDNDVEEELDDIAELMGIDRLDPKQVQEHGFPVVAQSEDITNGFCSGCLKWFG